MKKTTYPAIELSDIQGYIIRGYKRMQFSRNLLLQISEPGKARDWLSKISSEITTGVHHPTANTNIETCINIAFTPAGLTAIGLEDENLQNFTREFREGMTTPHRQRLLGDVGSSHPDEWEWGGPQKEPIHLLLILFADTNSKLLEYYQQVSNDLNNHAILEIKALDGQQLEANREHFGFRDGIGQPVVAGSGRLGPSDDTIATGEFIMGYKN